MAEEISKILGSNIHSDVWERQHQNKAVGLPYEQESWWHLAPTDIEMNLNLWERLGTAYEALRALKGYEGEPRGFVVGIQSARISRNGAVKTTFAELEQRLAPDGDPEHNHASMTYSPDTCPRCALGRRNGELLASEALYGFAGWLTSRRDRAIASATDDAAPIAELVGEFVKANNLSEPRQNWALRLKHPIDERDHDPACESLCTEGARCNCGADDLASANWMRAAGFARHSADEVNKLADFVDPLQHGETLVDAACRTIDGLRATVKNLKRENAPVSVSFRDLAAPLREAIGREVAANVSGAGLVIDVERFLGTKRVSDERLREIISMKPNVAINAESVAELKAMAAEITNARHLEHRLTGRPRTAYNGGLCNPGSPRPEVRAASALRNLRRYAPGPLVDDVGQAVSELVEIADRWYNACAESNAELNARSAGRWPQSAIDRIAETDRAYQGALDAMGKAIDVLVEKGGYERGPALTTGEDLLRLVNACIASKNEGWESYHSLREVIEAAFLDRKYKLIDDKLENARAIIDLGETVRDMGRNVRRLADANAEFTAQLANARACIPPLDQEIASLNAQLDEAKATEGEALSELAKVRKVYDQCWELLTKSVRGIPGVISPKEIIGDDGSDSTQLHLVIGRLLTWAYQALEAWRVIRDVQHDYARRDMIEPEWLPGDVWRYETGLADLIRRMGKEIESKPTPLRVSEIVTELTAERDRAIQQVKAAWCLMDNEPNVPAMRGIPFWTERDVDLDYAIAQREAAWMTRIDALHREIGKVHQERDALTDKLRHEIGALKNELGDVKLELARTTSSLHAQKLAGDEARALRDKLLGEVEVIGSNLVTAANERDAARAECDELTAEVRQLKGPKTDLRIDGRNYAVDRRVYEHVMELAIPLVKEAERLGKAFGFPTGSDDPAAQLTSAVERAITTHRQQVACTKQVCQDLAAIDEAITAAGFSAAPTTVQRVRNVLAAHAGLDRWMLAVNEIAKLTGSVEISPPAIVSQVVTLKQTLDVVTRDRDKAERERSEWQGQVSKLSAEIYDACDKLRGPFPAVPSNGNNLAYAIDIALSAHHQRVDALNAENVRVNRDLAMCTGALTDVANIAGVSVLFPLETIKVQRLVGAVRGFKETADALTKRARNAEATIEEIHRALNQAAVASDHFQADERVRKAVEALKWQEERANHLANLRIKIVHALTGHVAPEASDDKITYAVRGMNEEIDMLRAEQARLTEIAQVADADRVPVRMDLDECNRVKTRLLSLMTSLASLQVGQSLVISAEHRAFGDLYATAKLIDNADEARPRWSISTELGGGEAFAGALADAFGIDTGEEEI